MLVIDLIFQSDPYSLKELVNQVHDGFSYETKKFSCCPDMLPWFKDRGLVNQMGGDNGCREDGNCEFCLYDWLLDDAEFYHHFYEGDKNEK